jgi:hypothetical protein
LKRGWSSIVGIALFLGCRPSQAPPVALADTQACAVFTRNGRIAHLWIRPNGRGLDPELEIGMHLHDGNALVLPVSFQDPHMFETDTARWIREWGAYASTFWKPDTLFEADSGVVVLDTISEERMTGQFHIAGFATVRNPHAHSISQLSSRSRVTLVGRFGARHDTAYERQVYTSSGNQSERPVSNRCSATAPT